MKSAGKNSALMSIRCLSVLDSNYKTALAILRKSDSNKRELINALIKKLIAMSCILDAAQSILDIVDAINECVCSLCVFEQYISCFSGAIIVY